MFLQAQDGKCQYDPKNKAADDTGFVDIQSGNETALQAAVATVGPISIAIDASSIFFQLYSGRHLDLIKILHVVLLLL